MPMTTRQKRQNVCRERFEGCLANFFRSQGAEIFVVQLHCVTEAAQPTKAIVHRGQISHRARAVRVVRSLDSSPDNFFANARIRVNLSESGCAAIPKRGP
jgi:hypothetical protein